MTTTKATVKGSELLRSYLHEKHCMGLIEYPEVGPITTLEQHKLSILIITNVKVWDKIIRPGLGRIHLIYRINRHYRTKTKVRLELVWKLP